ncbi:MAG: hypothetical protein JNL05_15865 [Flavobacteriales bacterium]|nr:hypothetical protein [Flavobacteriales bacterium]
MPDTIEKVTIRAFRAVDDRETCIRFLMEQIRVLEDIGVSSVIKPDVSWCTDPDVIVVIAEHQLLGVVAGIRLHVAGSDKTLPMEQPVSKFDPNISHLLKDLQMGRTGEVAGLWNAHRFAGRGVPFLLFQSVVAIASQLRVESLVTFVAEYVAPYAAQCGFRMMHELAEGGNFVYPVPSIHTHAMVLDDPMALSNAQDDVRRRILGLRVRPCSSRQVKPKNATLDVDFSLMLNEELRTSFAQIDRLYHGVAA